MKAGNVEGETGGGEGGGECTRTRGKSGRERRGETQRLSDGRDKEAQRRTQERTSPARVATHGRRELERGEAQREGKRQRGAPGCFLYGMAPARRCHTGFAPWA